MATTGATRPSVRFLSGLTNSTILFRFPADVGPHFLVPRFLLNQHRGALELFVTLTAYALRLVSNLVDAMFDRHLRRSWLLPVSVTLAVLTAGVAAYAAWRYSWLPERDDAWKTWSVGYGQLGVAFDPSGSLIASGGWDYDVTIWDVRSGHLLHKLRGHRDRVYEVAFSPDGRRLASGSKDKTIRFWSVVDGTQLAVLKGHTDRVMALAISSDGQALVTGSRDSSLKLWDTSRYTEIGHAQPRSGFIAAVAFGPDGHAVLFGDWSGHVKLWRTNTDQIGDSRNDRSANSSCSFQL